MSDNTSIVNPVSDTIQHSGENLGENNSFTWSNGYQTECICQQVMTMVIMSL